MKQVKNKRYGDVGELDFDSKEGTFIVVFYNLNTKSTVKCYYKSIKELSEEWEDYEEPKSKGYWYINEFGTPTEALNLGRETIYDKSKKSFGNYFETEEEALAVVGKLKAWKRLRDRGFRFSGYNSCSVDYDIDEKYRKYIATDLNLLFGGEDE